MIPLVITSLSTFRACWLPPVVPLVVFLLLLADFFLLLEEASESEADEADLLLVTAARPGLALAFLFVLAFLPAVEEADEAEDLVLL